MDGFHLQIAVQTFGPAFAPHANGVARIVEIRASSDTPETAAVILGAALNAPVAGTRVASVPAPVVFTATPEAGAKARHRGGVYELVLAGAQDKGLMDMTLTHGARLLCA